MSNPFKPAEAVAPRVKCLVYGPSGVGKTYLALTAPGKVAVIDTEGGTAFYANRAGLSAFDVLPTKTFNDVTQAVAYLKSHPGEYETLVIDPVTVLYETLQDAAQVKRAGRRNDPDADLEMLDWQRIKRAYKALMTDLVNLPMHVIVTARERDDTEQRGREMVKIGTRPDAEKNTPYYFDTVIRLVVEGTARRAIVSKDRTGTLPAEVAAPSFAKLFGKAIKATGGAERVIPDDTAAAESDARTTFADGLVTTNDGGLVGTVTTQGTQDFEVRQSPDGSVLPFRVKDGRSSQIVVAHGTLADDLYMLRPTLIGERVTVWGQITTETMPGKGSYEVLHLTRIKTPDKVLPAPAVAPEDPVEAPSVPLFDDADMAAVDAELVS